MGAEESQAVVFGFHPSAGATCFANDSTTCRLNATPSWLGSVVARKIIVDSVPLQGDGLSAVADPFVDLSSP